MPDGDDSNNGAEEDPPTSTSAFAHGFGSGKDRAGDAERSTEALKGCTPGTGSGGWDEDEESVSGDVSAFVHGLEAGRDPWQPRQTAHGALHVMSGFLGPHFKNFQTVADAQRQVSEDPSSASGMAASTAASSAAQGSFRQAAKIGEEDQPSVSEEARRRLNEFAHETGGAVLVARGMTGLVLGVAVDPALGKAYAVTSDGKLYSVDLTTNAKRQIVTSGDTNGTLGVPSGLALDGDGSAYITDNSGAAGRLLRVDLSNGRVEVTATIASACGIALDSTATAYVTSFDGNLYEVDLRSHGQPKLIARDLGASTSAVALDGQGKAYTGNRDSEGSMRQVDLRAEPPVTPQVLPGASPLRSGGIVLDGAGSAYVTDHWKDVLYTVDLATGREREAVRAAGAFSPLGVALDRVHGLVYAGTWEGQLWRFPLRVLQGPELIEITTRV
ncbi:YncE family protein [Streptomyces sp. NPDC048361]|uniref:YncE family protein n=1 Tax=Streptomyces sp. NPDC048361 TaxID=3154720 RepID=UPI003415CEB9